MMAFYYWLFPDAEPFQVLDGGGVVKVEKEHWGTMTDTDTMMR